MVNQTPASGPHSTRTGTGQKVSPRLAGIVALVFFGLGLVIGVANRADGPTPERESRLEMALENANKIDATMKEMKR